MAEDQERVTYFGETDSRGKRVKFGIKTKDRTRHLYVIGKTGMGKSTLLENMAIQDLRNGSGMAFLDPHGKTADLLLEYIPPERIKDVVYFAPFDIEHPISFNVMEDVGPDKRHLVVSGLMSAFKKLFGEESFSDRMQYILQNAILALLEYPDATMLGINRMFTDKAYRNKVVANVKDTSVKAYWTQEFANYTERFAQEATPAIQNKIGQFTSNPLIRNIIGQPKSSFDFRKIMDEGKIMIINLSKGRVGEANANLLGSMLITKIYLAAMSRADISEKDLKNLPNFYLYVDEFQSFANESFADILSEARKYKLNLTIAHQYIEQMPEEVRAAVFGNVGTMITFRVGAYDAEVLEKEFAPQFTAEDLVNLGIFQMYLKLMINGASSAPFSASSLPPFPEPVISYKEEIIETSRKQSTVPRMEVEANIQKWHDDGAIKPKVDGPLKLTTPTHGGFRSNTLSNDSHRGNLANNTGSSAIQAPIIKEQSRPIPMPIIEPKKEIFKENSERKPEIRTERQEPRPEPKPVEKMEDDVSDDFVPLKDLLKKVQTVPEEKIAEQKPYIHPNQKPVDKKEPTKENLSGLKSALESALKNKIENVPHVPRIEEKKPEQVKFEEKKPQEIPKVIPLTKEENPKEIPEAELKKILGIE